MFKDPVCGMDVDERKIPAVSTFGGKHYAFCGQECKNIFDEDPEAYVPAEQRQETARRR